MKRLVDEARHEDPDTRHRVLFTDSAASLLEHGARDPLARRLVLVDAAGAVTVVTPVPGARSVAGLDDLAVAADGSAVGWREEGADQM